MAVDANISAPPTTELGHLIDDVGYVPGWGALVADQLEVNEYLRFPNNVIAYNQMRNDAQLQGLIAGSLWPLFRMRWYLDSGKARPDIVEKIAADLNLPIDKQEFVPRRTRNRFKFLQHLEDALEAIVFGFQVFEQVGVIGDDGFFHYTKLANRPIQDIAEMRIAKDGGIEWIKQHGIDAPRLNINRLVWYAFQKRGANWTGRSMLRGAYGPWLLKDRAMRIGVMNLQRAGVGTPIIEAHQGASEAELIILRRMAEKFKAGERSGGAVPFGAKVRLVGVEGSQPDANGFIKLMNEEMARAFLQMFMQLGQSASGSRALGSAFIDWHKLTLEFIAMWFASIFNEHVIEDDMDWNYPNEEYAPILRWEWDEEDPSAQDPTQKLRDTIEEGKVQVPSDVQSRISS
jgi:hypothetical protein